MKFTNNNGLGLSMAVYLVTDDYDYDARPTAISTTSMLKSTRQLILRKRVRASQLTMDISDLAASSFGSSVHDAVEKAWSNGRYRQALAKLGYTQSVIDRIVVNPEPRIVIPKDQRNVPNRPIPVYIEQRAERELDGIIVTGKYDFVGDGELEDHKTTGVYTYIKGEYKKNFRIQGSIYRWLNPDIITSDRMVINFTFTDWSALRYKIEKNLGYPPSKMMAVPVALMPMEETERWLKDRIQQYKLFRDAPEQALPPCTPEELWQKPTVYKYYKNPQNKTKSTKNFDNFAEAQDRLIKDGSTGIIDIIKGEVKACLYCPAAPICSQAKQLVVEKLLDMDL